MENRLKPVALADDLKQAFLQIRIRLEGRDALGFHWIKDRDASNVEVLRPTCALFLWNHHFCWEGPCSSSWKG